MAEENGQSRYIVQVSVSWEDGDAAHQGWEDIATVVVPPRTRRKTILEKAFADHPDLGPVVGHRMNARVLDAESYEPIPVISEEQPPRLKIG